MIRIGARAHDFGNLSADDLAATLAGQNLCCAQLALNAAIKGLALKPGQLNPGLAWEIGQAFQRNGVQIAVLGCYINPIHPDLTVRASLIEFFKDHLRHVRDLGGSLVGLETGTPNADYSAHHDTGSEENFQAMLRTMEQLVAEAEKQGVKVAVEAVTHHTTSTPARMKRLLDEISSTNLVVIHDPVNLINAENASDQARMIEEPFQLYGDRIKIIHAKDFSMEKGAYKQIPTGFGELDYTRLCRLIDAAGPGMSILLEESSPDTVEHCIAHIRKHWPSQV
ncbi:MAG: sugar phosphate isomerase/epimerase [Pontiellaceae bacterium]|nr:sugar phosphate isomerase/epimerase [Pontiellaceae bacterium]